MKSMPIATLEDFFASPEMEAAFKAWSEKYTAAATKDLSPTALEPFPYQQASTPPTYIKDSPLMEIIEQSDSEPADEQARRVRG